LGRLRTGARACLAAALAAAALAGCGGAAGRDGTATLWITRDRGATVIATASVPAGLTVMQALDREADIETRYGGRYVQSVNGLEGSLSRGWDWFYFVNGVAGDRGAAEYRLRAGEVAWWDYRRWRGRREDVVVVGAFPEPFVHGYAGKVRPVVVRYTRASQRPTASAVGRLVRATSVASSATPPPGGANVVRIVVGPPGLLSATAESAGGPYALALSEAAARRLVQRPALARYRYEGLP
jgi:hypothetical protein